MNKTKDTKPKRLTKQTTTTATVETKKATNEKVTCECCGLTLKAKTEVLILINDPLLMGLNRKIIFFILFKPRIYF